MSFQGHNLEFSGHLVKKIRKFLGLRQYELVGDQITRNLISLIENNKIPLTNNAAAIIISNVNQVAQEKGMLFRIEEQDLRIDGLFEARYQLEEYVEILRTGSFIAYPDVESFFTEVYELMNHWDLPDVKARILLHIADYYHNNGNYSSSCLNYLKGFENVIRTNDSKFILAFSSKLIDCSLESEQYKETVHYATYVESLSDIEESVLAPILYKKALAYDRLLEHESCLHEVEKLEALAHQFSNDDYYNFMVLKGRSYKALNELNASRDVFSKLAIATIGENYRLNALDELIDLLISQDDTIELGRYAKLMEDVLPDFTVSQKPYLYLALELSKTYLHFRDYPRALSYAYTTLESLGEIHDEFVMSQLLDILNHDKLSHLIDDAKLKPHVLLWIEHQQSVIDSKVLLHLIRFLNKRKLSALIEDLLKSILTR